jgi:hypothetical protein
MIVIMSSCNLKNNLFDNDLVLESCILDDENQYLIKAMKDNDCIDYSFVNSIIVSSICETLKISSMKLNKSRKIKKYDKRMSDSITHVIYSRMIIEDYVESFIFLLITKLSQHDIILEKSWMWKHEMSYHNHWNNIFFLSNHCSHLETLKRFFSILSTKIKEMLQESRKKINNFKFTRILKSDEKIELFLFIQRNQIIKKSKTKKLIEIEIEIEIKNLIEIVIQKKKRRRKKRRNQSWLNLTIRKLKWLKQHRSTY